MQGLFDLDINDFHKCIPYLKGLLTDHFSHHQASDLANEVAAGRHLWIFGVIVGKLPKPGKTSKKPQRAAYVKIQMGHTALQAVCISFHRPKRRLTFPFSSAYQLQFDDLL